MQYIPRTEILSYNVNFFRQCLEQEYFLIFNSDLIIEVDDIALGSQFCFILGTITVGEGVCLFSEITL